MGFSLFGWALHNLSWPFELKIYLAYLEKRVVLVDCYVPIKTRSDELFVSQHSKTLSSLILAWFFVSISFGLVGLFFLLVLVALFCVGNKMSTGPSQELPPAFLARYAENHRVILTRDTRYPEIK